MVSEVGFGAWGIGGGYGDVARTESLNALAKAEELGCNFVDTAMVYGDSEQVLGEFLRGRRANWFVATKYSGQSAGMIATIEKQLQALQTDAVDLYQLHWYPRGQDEYLFDELDRLKQAGKARFIGVSLSSAVDIRDVLARPSIDAFQVPLSLLEPEPFLTCIGLLSRHRKAVVIRSALREGFLTGKYKRDAVFPDRGDQRHKLTPDQIAEIVDQAERFRFLEQEAGSMVAAAARYPLSFAPVSTVVLGTKTAQQSRSNFGEVPGILSPAAIEQIRVLQLELGLRGPAWRRWATRIRLSL
jgi:aryl-alcohol dehydrogenase-like predicted oxidoreductase